MAYKYKEDEQAAKHRHYIDNKADYISRKDKRKELLREFLKNYKSLVSCVVCGMNEPICIDFHHKDPDEKDKAVSVLINCGSLKKLKEEISKCIPLCANCHRKVHSGIINL